MNQHITPDSFVRLRRVTPCLSGLRALAGALLLAWPATAQFFHTLNPTQVTSPTGLLTLATDVAGNRLIGVDNAGDTFALLYSPTALTWSAPLASAPTLALATSQLTTRGTGAGARVFAYDSAAQTAFELVGNSWTSVTIPASPRPSSRLYPVLCGRPDGTVVLFGGQNGFGGCALKDTWIWDGANWTEKVVQGPSARFLASSTFDGTGVLVFGGYDGTFLSDTWRMTGDGVWTDLQLQGPSGRLLAGMAHRPRDNEVVLVAGFGLTSTGFGGFAEGWFLRNGTWFPIQNPNITLTSGIVSAALEPAHDEVIVLEGSSWSAGPTFVNSVKGAINSAVGCPCSTTTPNMLLATGSTTALPGTIGNSFTIFILNWTGAQGPLLMAIGTSLQVPPVQIGGFPAGCMQNIANISATVSPAFNPAPQVVVTVPNNLNLLGMRVTYQATGFGPTCVSDAVEVRVGR